jgi:hypothetical protein
MIVTKIPVPLRNSPSSSASDIRPTTLLLSLKSEHEDGDEQPKPHESSKKRTRQDGCTQDETDAQSEPSKKQRSEDALGIMGPVVKNVVDEKIDERLSNHALDIKEYIKEQKYALASNLATVAEVVVTTGKQISALLGDVTELKGDATNLTQDVTNHTQIFATHEDRLANISKTTCTMNKTLDNFKITCAGIESKFDLAMGGLKIVVDSSRERVDDVEKQVATVKATVAALRINGRLELADAKEKFDNYLEGLDIRYD